jgi:predicted RNase H-like HicB family nuclease
MLTEYICAALRHAEYEKIEDGSWFARIPGLQGVWGNGPTVEEARNDLQGALEGWILLGLRLGNPVPPVDGIDLTPALDVA